MVQHQPNPATSGAGAAVTDFHRPRHRCCAEECLDNEKVELRPRGCAAAKAAGRSLAPFITRLNTIHRQNPALHWLRVHAREQAAI